jgi:hypothetical protein
MKRLLAFAVASVSLLAAQGYAVCTSPTANAGQMTYASNAGIMVYCDGTNWISMAGGVSQTINNSGSPAVTPGGSTNSVQYNGGGTFAGDTFFTYSGGLLTVTNISTSSNITAGGYVSATTYYGDGSHLTGISTSSALGDRIVSGTLSAIANSATGYISLTTGATNWGYLSSGQSFIPALASNFLSSTNVSMTVSHLNSQPIGSVAGGGGNYIVSATASVSASSANGGAVRVGTSSGVVVTVSGSNMNVSGTITGSVASNFSSITAASTDTGTGTWMYSSWVSCPTGMTLIMKAVINCTGTSGNTYEYCACNNSGNSLQAGYLSGSGTANSNYSTVCQALCAK